MSDEPGNTVIAFNGEIYNHAALREELKHLGHSFHSHCDTEVVLHAFLEWDIDSFSRLRGMFAIALWSESENRLVLARDRLGIKPLYLSRQAQNIYFASELKAILIHQEIQRRLSMDGLNLFLTMNYVPGNLTLVDGVEKLAPGTWLEWRSGHVKSDAFWKLRMEPRETWTLPAACRQLDILMQESIRDHLVADVPVGIWLSGGIDSTTILHYARQVSSQPIKTFSVTFRGQSFDEASLIKETVARYGTEHYEIDVNPSMDLPGVIEKLAYYADEPCADSGALPVWFLSQLTATHGRVALSGEGGDELFAGYLTYSADLIARRLRKLPSPLLKAAVRISHLWPVSDEKVGLEYCAKRLLAGSLLPPDEGHVYWNGTFTAAERSAFFATSDIAPLRSLMSTLESPVERNGSLSRFFEYDYRYYLADDILCKVDRMSMAHSIEVRPPFLDHRIVEFSASLPDSFKLRGLVRKRILRELMKDKLPAATIRRRKIGLDIPTHEWFRGPLRPLLSDILNARSIRSMGLFEWEPLRAMIQAHHDRRANIGFHLWGLLNLVLWMKQWNINTWASDGETKRCSIAAVAS